MINIGNWGVVGFGTVCRRKRTQPEKLIWAANPRVRVATYKVTVECFQICRTVSFSSYDDI
jgi:hypothetical protein